MHSGNARIHGMVCISLPLIAYIATQVYCLNFVSYSSYIPDYRLGLPSVPPQSFPRQILQWLRKVLQLYSQPFDDPNVEGSVGLLANSPIPRDFSWALTSCANTIELSHSSPFVIHSLLNHVTEFIIFTSSSLHIQQLSMTFSGTFPTSRTKNPVQWGEGYSVYNSFSLFSIFISSFILFYFIWLVI